jgi:hypothetical protein
MSLLVAARVPDEAPTLSARAMAAFPLLRHRSQGVPLPDPAINLVRGPAAVDADPELIGCSPLPARVRGHDRTPLNVTGAARRKLTPR